MNKQIIWAIVGLMSAAVIGIVWLQMDLISSSYRVEEKDFENNVSIALKQVETLLANQEKQQQSLIPLNGYMYTAYKREQTFGNKIRRTLFSTGITNIIDIKVEGVEKSQLNNRLISDFANERQLCANCMARLDNDYSRYPSGAFYQQDFSNIPLEERISLDYLNKALQEQLSNNNVNTDYTYGVYSSRKKSFVIFDGHYAVEENAPQELLAGIGNESNPSYKIHLFSEESPSPGVLMIHFPGRTQYLWRSLVSNLVGMVLFTAVILFCFGYTVSVIFKQKRLSEMKTDFINNMTHEFKTPIATISLAADSISSPIISGNSDKVARFANIIKQENTRMNSQVEKVLQMALLDKKDFSLKMTEINLHDVVHRAVENISLQVEKRNGTAIAVLNATSPIIEGDVTHISNIVNNLLDNANKYSPENPEISVTTRNVPNGVEVIVKDKGIGMNKEVRKHIFDKFYRVHTGNLHDVKGFGLGLSYVKAMMTAHKGTIDVKSEEGKGSSFILFFPFHVEN